MSLSTNKFISNYEYPKIGSILAQFASIFNVLLFLGYLGQYLSEKELESGIQSII